MSKCTSYSAVGFQSLHLPAHPILPTTSKGPRPSVLYLHHQCLVVVVLSENKYITTSPHLATVVSETSSQLSLSTTDTQLRCSRRRPSLPVKVSNATRRYGSFRSSTTIGAPGGITRLSPHLSPKYTRNRQANSSYIVDMQGHKRRATSAKNMETHKYTVLGKEADGFRTLGLLSDACGGRSSCRLKKLRRGTVHIPELVSSACDLWHSDYRVPHQQMGVAACPLSSPVWSKASLIPTKSLAAFRNKDVFTCGRRDRGYVTCANRHRLARREINKSPFTTWAGGGNQYHNIVI